MSRRMCGHCISRGNLYQVDSPEIGRQIVRDIQGHSLESHKIYHFVNGEMMPNLDASAPVGISKKKESPVTNE